MDEWPIDELFDDDYLHFYATRLDADVTDGEADVVWELLGLRAGDDVLDLACGHGRIANRLAERSARVVALDATERFLELAREDAAARDVQVEYVHGDMRSLPWTDRFDAIVSWFTAYGYFDDDQNRAVLREVHRALRPGGRFLVELNHKEGLLPHWVPSTVVESPAGAAAGGLMIDEREFDPLTGRSNARRTVIRNGTMRQFRFFTRLFSYTELRDWLLDTGFAHVEGFAGDGTPLTAASRRMILVAHR